MIKNTTIIILLSVVCVTLSLSLVIPEYQQPRITTVDKNLLVVLQMQEDYRGGILGTAEELEIGRILTYQPTIKLKIISLDHVGTMLEYKVEKVK